MVAVCYLKFVWGIFGPSAKGLDGLVCAKFSCDKSRYLIQIIASFASFSAFKISQGSVATHLRRGGIFINNFIASFLLNVSVKELRKSVNI